MGDSFRVNTGTVPEGFIRVECGSTCERGGHTVTIIGRGVDEGMIVVREEGGEITVCPSLGMTSFTEISKEKLKIQAEDRYFDTNKYHLSWKENGQEKLGGEHDGSATVRVVEMGSSAHSFKVKTWGNGYTGVWWNDRKSRGELHGSLQTSGYLQCNVGRDKFLLHRIIATACFPLPLGDPRRDVNHKDGYRQNNSYKNLEWCTSEENEDDKYLRQGTDLLIRTGRLLGILNEDDFKKYLENDLVTVTTQFNEYREKKEEFMTVNNKGETLTDREFDKRKYRERVRETKARGGLPSVYQRWEREIRGHEYLVGTDGRVWSRRTSQRKKGKPEHQWVQCAEVVNADGYVRTLKTPVHKIMAKVWKIETLRDEQVEVNHKDGYRWNNSIDNLEWCTKKENLENAWKRQCIDVLLRQTRSSMESIEARIGRFIDHAVEKWKTYESSRTVFFC